MAQNISLINDDEKKQRIIYRTSENRCSRYRFVRGVKLKQSLALILALAIRTLFAFELGFCSSTYEQVYFHLDKHSSRTKLSMISFQHNETANLPKTNPISYNGDSCVQNRRRVHHNLVHGNSTNNSNLKYRRL